MAALTAITAAAAIGGLGLAAYGMSEQKRGAETSAAGARIAALGAEKQSEGALWQSAGAQTQVVGAQQQNAAQKEIARQEFLAEEQRFNAMEIDARRRSLEVIRQEQRARALGLTAATAQGAARGSGLQGGYGQASGMATDNLLGISQNLAIGRNIFEINRAISNQRLAYAEGGDVINAGSGLIARGSGIIAEGSGIIARGGGMSAAGAGISAGGAGMTQLGVAIMNSAPTVSNLVGGINYNSLFAPTNYNNPSTYSGWARTAGGIY